MRTELRGALVVVYTGKPARRGDVEVVDGRIGAIGTVAADVDADRVDLSGPVLAPGFINIHTHLDARVFWDPDLTWSLHGVTTAVLVGKTSPARLRGPWS